MLKRFLIVIPILFLVFGGLVVFNLYRQKMIKEFMVTHKPPPSEISTVKATAENWVPNIPSVGTLSAINGVTLSTEVAGTVVRINFKSGQLVKAGDSLIQLDDSLDVQDLKNSQAQMNLDQLDFNRKKKLYSQKAISTSEYDTSLAVLRQSQAQVNKALVTISKKNIRAPFSGKIGIRQVNLGQYIQPSDDIVTLQSLDPLYVNFSLPEQNLPKLYLGQKVSVKVTAYPKQLFYGTVTAINSQITKTTRNIDVQATIPNPKYLLYPGSFADVAVYLPEQKSVVALPQTAISYSLYGNIVYVVLPAGKDKEGKATYKVQQRVVKVGSMMDDKVIVESGVKAGDEVVSSGQVKLENDSPVIINNSLKLKVPPQESLEGGKGV